MPARTLPTFTRAEVKSHNTKASCYVTIQNKVYDVTDFVDDHPGGGDLILEYAGKDIENILKDQLSHTHSESAYDILDDSVVGFVMPENAITNGFTSKNGIATLTPPDSDAEDNNTVELNPRTGMSCAEDLSKDTDYSQDFKKFKFLDLDRPLFFQLWNGGFSSKFYLEQVHRPRHYKGGQSAPLFGNFLEPLTKTPWWVVPTLWLPCVAYGTYTAARGLSSIPHVAAYWGFGLLAWTLIEYILHRCLFHIDK